MILATSVLSVFIVGVTDWVVATRRRVTRLLVRVWVAVRPAIVCEVLGNVMIVASVPARVSVLLTVRSFPLAIEDPRYWEFQFAAVVGVATSAVNNALVPAARIVIVFAPEDCTVTAPVLRLMIAYWPPAATDVVGRRTVWVVVPVNTCV